MRATQLLRQAKGSSLPLLLRAACSLQAPAGAPQARPQHPDLNLGPVPPSWATTVRRHRHSETPSRSEALHRAYSTPSWGTPLPPDASYPAEVPLRPQTALHAEVPLRPQTALHAEVPLRSPTALHAEVPLRGDSTPSSEAPLGRDAATTSPSFETPPLRSESAPSSEGCDASTTASSFEVPLPCYWASGGPTRGSAGGPPAPELLVSRVACQRDEETVFRDVSMTVHQGGALLLTGPNGSGKSSMLRLLSGLLRPSAGYVMWRGHDVTNPDVYDLYRVNVHLVANQDAIKGNFTVDTNVRFWAQMEGTSGRVPWALDQVGLGHYAQELSSTLSLGQRKRLQLARLLAMPRSIWLLDEPSVGLDSQGLEMLEWLIDDHRRCGGIALVATHTPIQMDDCMHLRFASRR